MRPQDYPPAPSQSLREAQSSGAIPAQRYTRRRPSQTWNCRVVWMRLSPGSSRSITSPKLNTSHRRELSGIAIVSMSKLGLLPENQMASAAVESAPEWKVTDQFRRATVTDCLFVCCTNPPGVQVGEMLFSVIVVAGSTTNHSIAPAANSALPA